MASCYWAQPGQLHPWYKPDSLKRKPPPMLTHSESPSPVDDEYDPDPRAKRQRLDQTRSTKKRKLPSPPQSPVEDPVPGSGDPRFFKRQRYTTLERGIEVLSLTTPGPALPQAASTPIPTPQAQVHAAFFVPRLVAPVSAVPVYRHAPDFASSSPPLPPPFTPTPAAALVADADAAVPDVKMRSSSWYEPEKDRIVVTDLDVLSEDEAEAEADVVDDAPKLPRSVLQALLRGPERGGDDPRLADLLSLVAPSSHPHPHPSHSYSHSLDPPPPPLLDLGFSSDPGQDEVMDIE